MEGEGRRTQSVSLTEALEEYSNAHPESVEELLHWPARRFDHFYLLHQQRKVIEGLEEQKRTMVAALWSNPNWDDTKGTRTNQIEKIESHYEEAVEKIHNIIHYGAEEEPGEEIDKDNPFFAAAERGVKKLYEKFGEDLPEKSEEIDYMKDVDQG